METRLYVRLYQQKCVESQKNNILNFKLNTEQGMSDRNSSQDHKNLTFSNLIIINRLGRGSTSHVFKTQSIRSKQYYAMKVIDKCKSDYNTRNLIKQLEIHQLLKHRYIVQFIHHFQDEGNHYILTEYCNKGEITKYLIQPIKYGRMLRVLYQVGQALEYMHNGVGVAHGDVKLSNILICGSDYKLCDFGFSVLLAQGEKDQGKNNQIFGTLLYMSPEILIHNRNKYYKESDVWALGICILTLMVQGNPYQAENPTLLKKKIINNEMIRINTTNFPGYPQQFLDLVSRMLEQDYRKRIKIEQLLKHSIFAKFATQKLSKIEQVTEKEDNDAEKQNESDINQRCFKSSEIQKEDINKSVFNSTIDTLVDTEDNSTTLGDNLKIWSYSLKPQKYETENHGFIEILSDHTIKIKVQKLEYLIMPNGSGLQVIKGAKNSKKYNISQINQNKKIKNLFDYGADLVQILKKKQCHKEKIIDGKYFWLTKTSLSCLINDSCIIERQSGSKQIVCKRIGQDSTLSSAQMNQIMKNLPIFQKGETTFLQNLN